MIEAVARARKPLLTVVALAGLATIALCLLPWVTQENIGGGGTFTDARTGTVVIVEQGWHYNARGYNIDQLTGVSDGLLVLILGALAALLAVTVAPGRRGSFHLGIVAAGLAISAIAIYDGLREWGHAPHARRFLSLSDAFADGEVTPVLWIVATLGLGVAACGSILLTLPKNAGETALREGVRA